MREAIEQGKMGPSDIEETLKDAVNFAIQDMTEAHAKTLLHYV